MSYDPRTWYRCCPVCWLPTGKARGDRIAWHGAPCAGVTSRWSTSPRLDDSMRPTATASCKLSNAKRATVNE